jgi:hypothetical protein
VKRGYDGTSNPLCCRVHDDVRAEVDGPAVVSSGTECVVHDDGNASLVCDCDDPLEVWDVVLWVADTLELFPHQPSLTVQCLLRLT